MTVSDNNFYDDEFNYAIFREEVKEHKINNLLAENRLLKDLIQEALPVVMEAFSEEVYSAGWMYDLDIFAPKEDPLIGKMAKVLGEIPFWNNGDLDWRVYPGERDFDDKA
jgi:hypothetical protein